MGALFDAQDCTLWDFTLVYEKLLEQRYVAVDEAHGTRVCARGDAKLRDEKGFDDMACHLEMDVSW